MAVPPRGVRVIFEAVLKSFAGVDYPKTDNNIRNNLYSSSVDTYQMMLLEEQEEYAAS
jgi:DNA (cytosine-5)-methyltransferase 1